MGLTRLGREFLTAQIAASGNKFDNLNAYIGVGNGTEPFNPEQTDLTGISTARHIMDVNYPMIGGSTITFQAIFSDAEANFEWNEWGVFNAETGGLMIARKVEYNSIKLSNQEWIMKVTLELEDVTDEEQP